MDWQPVETAPKDGTQILVCGPHSENLAIVRWGRANSQSDEWVCVADGFDAIESSDDFYTVYRTFELPSHWMPLPGRPH